MGDLAGVRSKACWSAAQIIAIQGLAAGAILDNQPRTPAAYWRVRTGIIGDCKVEFNVSVFSADNGTRMNM